MPGPQNLIAGPVATDTLPGNSWSRFWDGFTWAQGATLLAALIAVGGVALTILTNAARARREHLATLYADALHGVADYLEGPYRIRRKDGTCAHRNAITAALSDVKSGIDHSQGLLRLHARPEVGDAFDLYVEAAKREAGQQMHDAWLLPPVTSDAEVNLDVGYDRTLSDEFRAHVVDLMQAELARRLFSVKAARHFREVVRKAPLLPPRKSELEQGEQ